MSFSDSIADDNAMMDDPLTITIVQVAGSDTTTVAVDFVQGSEISADEVYASEGFYSFGDMRFVAPENRLGSLIPKIGDKIVDSDGVAWQIIKATKDGTGGSWDLPSKKER